MSFGTLDGIGAYARVLGNAGKPASKPAAGDSPSFGAMVETMVGDTAAKLHSAESASAHQVAGKGDLIDVVTAIGAAETALDTMVAVRDKVVAAYQDIMRMQI